MSREAIRSRQLRSRIVEFLRKQPRTTLLAVGYLLVFVIGVVDYATPPDLSFLTLYLIPVFLVTFFVGTWAGVLIAVAGIAVWFLANIRDLAEQSQTMIPFWNLAEKLGIFFLMTYLLAALKNTLEHEKELARVDPLTGAANRGHFQETFQSETARARRYLRPFTFVDIDVDNFKAVNDRFGSDAGDRLLRTLTETMREGVREVDTVARLGGDEFALLMPETGYDDARTVVENLKEKLSAGMQANGWPVTFTIGAVTYLSPIHTFDMMIGTVDRMMYAGKKSGTNTVAHRLVGAPEAPPNSVPGGRPSPPQARS